MLTIIEATEFLNLCPICLDIQNKILMLFIGINGTPTSNMIKTLTKCPDISFNGSLVEKILLENDYSIWKIKVFLSNAKVFNSFTLKNLRVLYELRIAYLTYDIKYNLQAVVNTVGLLDSIKTNSDSDLFGMFYNLDKNKYKYLGTPTANIIHNAIENKILNEVDPMIWYEVDPDAKYY